MSGAVEGVELLPCPFCGAAARRFTIGEEEPNNAGGDVIVCTSCQASSHVEFGRKENLVSLWNTRTTPPARSYADEDVARIIDPHAWGWHDRWLKEAETEPMAGRAKSLRNDARGHVAASLAKAAAIRLLSQGGKA